MVQKPLLSGHWVEEVQTILALRLCLKQVPRSCGLIWRVGGCTGSCDKTPLKYEENTVQAEQ
jgi:hypothetical protein